MWARCIMWDVSSMACVMWQCGGMRNIQQAHGSRRIGKLIRSEEKHALTGSTLKRMFSAAVINYFAKKSKVNSPATNKNSIPGNAANSIDATHPLPPFRMVDHPC